MHYNAHTDKVKCVYVFNIYIFVHNYQDDVQIQVKVLHLAIQRSFQSEKYTRENINDTNFLISPQNLVWNILISHSFVK